MYEITKSTLIGDILDNASEVAPLFYSIGMYCLSCDSSRSETLEEACQVHGVDADAFLDQVTAWQQTCQDDPEAAAQAAQAYTMFGTGYDDYGVPQDDSWTEFSKMFGSGDLSEADWSVIDQELAAFGIGSGYSGFSSEFGPGETLEGPDKTPDSNPSDPA